MPVESRILILRHQRVILDSDLAELYGVPARQLNQQVKRNRERFPADFMFQLTAKEDGALRSQIVISKKGRGGGRRYPPYAFTEHGAIMAATVLNSKQAIEMSVFVVRAFVRMREMLAQKPSACRQNKRVGSPPGNPRHRDSGHHRSHQGTHGSGGTVEAQDRLSASAGQELMVGALAGESPAATQTQNATCGAAGRESRPPASPWPRYPTGLPKLRHALRGLLRFA